MLSTLSQTTACSCANCERAGWRGDGGRNTAIPGCGRNVGTLFATGARKVLLHGNSSRCKLLWRIAHAPLGSGGGNPATRLDDKGLSAEDKGRAGENGRQLREFRNYRKLLITCEAAMLPGHATAVENW